ncbi:MAG: histidine phosphatase family protein [Prochloraceae cyanobacterium]|nr:histidine phosphatase family protein [Prochloraceae cyanobacterium]
MYSQLSDRAKAMETKNTRVILVRHGRSTYNEQGRYQGTIDDSILTEIGRHSCYQTGIALGKIGIDAIYTSPLKRTQQTADRILSGIGTVADSLPPLHFNDSLKEIGMFHWEGLSFQYVREQFASEYRLWKQRPHQFSVEIPQTEHCLEGNLAVKTQKECFPVLDLWKRARHFWQEILPRHLGQTIVVVSHSGTIRALISTAIGLDPARYHCLQQSNCGINILNFPQGQIELAQLQLFNYTNHLGEILPKLKEGKQGLRLLLVSNNTPSQQLTGLVQFLQQESIEFALSNGCANSHATAAKILQDRPNTLHLQVSREDLPEAWHQTIHASSLVAKSEQLITGLVVGSQEILKGLIAEVVGKSKEHLNNFNLSLERGKATVIHYPSSDRSPILQGVNIGSSLFTGK